MKVQEDTLKRPPTSIRRKKNANGEVQITLSDAFTGKFGTNIHNRNNKSMSRMIFFKFQCDYCVGKNQLFLIQHSEKSHYESLK